MEKKKAVICTILFAVVILSIETALCFVRPHDSEISLFLAFSPVITGLWISERIMDFYKWLVKDK